MSKWASPIVVVPKKSAPGEPPKRRLCVDFRKVNELQQEVIMAGKTKGQISIHPLPKIDEMYAKLKGAKVFSTIDLRSGYHHIALGKSSRAKTAFVMPFGKYEFLMVPFGLAQAPAYFQLLMNKVLKGLKFAMTYLDNIIIFSQDESQHLEHLEIVFSHLREAGLKMKCSKCDFFKSEIHYLGHLISPEGISPLPNKLDSIKHMPAPNSTKEIKQFLGLTGYYRKFVPRFADISRPLTTLTKKDAKFEWTSACQKSFELLKEALCGEPVLKYADTSKPYTLYTEKFVPQLVQDNPNTLPQASQNQNPAHPQGGRGSRGGFRGRGGRGRGRGRGGLILCYWCRDFLPKEQANHKVANCPYQNQARDAWWKRQLGNGATLPTRSIPFPVGNLSGNTQQEDQENC